MAYGRSRHDVGILGYELFALLLGMLFILNAWCLPVGWLAAGRLGCWVTLCVQHRRRTWNTRGPRASIYRAGTSLLYDSTNLLCRYGDGDGSVIDLVTFFTHPRYSPCCTMIGRAKSRAVGWPG